MCAVLSAGTLSLPSAIEYDTPVTRHSSNSQGRLQKAIKEMIISDLYYRVTDEVRLGNIVAYMSPTKVGQQKNIWF